MRYPRRDAMGQAARRWHHQSLQRKQLMECPKPGKPEPYRIRCSPETPGAGGEVEAAADGPLSRAPFRRALVL